MLSDSVKEAMCSDKGFFDKLIERANNNPSSDLTHTQILDIANRVPQWEHPPEEKCTTWNRYRGFATTKDGQKFEIIVERDMLLPEYHLQIHTIVTRTFDGGRFFPPRRWDSRENVPTYINAMFPFEKDSGIAREVYRRAKRGYKQRETRLTAVAFV
jgi:hypothetical protein